MVLPTDGYGRNGESRASIASRSWHASPALQTLRLGADEGSPVEPPVLLQLQSSPSSVSTAVTQRTDARSVCGAACAARPTDL